MTTATNVSFSPWPVLSIFNSLTHSIQWLLNWAIAYSTPYLVNYGDGYANLQSKIFFVWFGACFICIAFVYFFIYETKGLTLEEVDELYDDVKKASASKNWTPSTTFKQRGNVAQGGVVEAEKTSSDPLGGNNSLEATHSERNSTQV
jgi:MFS transporter, SP family, sugar:H+ symporter